MSNYSQNLAKAKESYEELQQEKDREIEENKRNFEASQAKLQEEITDIVSRFCSVTLHHMMVTMLSY